MLYNDHYKLVTSITSHRWISIATTITPNIHNHSHCQRGSPC